LPVVIAKVRAAVAVDHHDWTNENPWQKMTIIEIHLKGKLEVLFTTYSRRRTQSRIQTTVECKMRLII
jgi:hypothetical protein